MTRMKRTQILNRKTDITINIPLRVLPLPPQTTAIFTTIITIIAVPGMTRVVKLDSQQELRGLPRFIHDVINHNNVCLTPLIKLFFSSSVTQSRWYASTSLISCHLSSNMCVRNENKDVSMSAQTRQQTIKRNNKWMTEKDHLP